MFTPVDDGICTEDLKLTDDDGEPAPPTKFVIVSQTVALQSLNAGPDQDNIKEGDQVRIASIFSHPIGSEVEVDLIIRDRTARERRSGFVIFNYHSATEFKFAGGGYLMTKTQLCLVVGILITSMEVTGSPMLSSTIPLHRMSITASAWVLSTARSR